MEQETIHQAAAPGPAGNRRASAGKLTGQKAGVENEGGLVDPGPGPA